MPTAPIFLIAPTATDQASAESVRDFLDRLRATSAQPAVDALTPAEIVAVRGMLGEYDELCRNAATILERIEADLDKAAADVTDRHHITLSPGGEVQPIYARDIQEMLATIHERKAAAAEKSATSPTPTVEAPPPPGGETGTVGAPTPAPTAADLVAMVRGRRRHLHEASRILYWHAHTEYADDIAAILGLAEVLASAVEVAR